MKSIVEQNQEYANKLFLEALIDDKNVIQGAHVSIVTDPKKGRKIRAWCEETKCYIQFPTKLRFLHQTYIADVIEMKPDGRKTFYRAVKGSIRNMSGQIIG